jgi:hypothetical protein
MCVAPISTAKVGRTPQREDVIDADCGELVSESVATPTALRTLFLFEALPEEHLLALATEGALVDYDAGVLFCEGDPARYFFVLVDGELIMSKWAAGRDVETGRTRHRSAYGGAVAAFIDNPPPGYTFTVRTARPTTFVRIGAEFFGQFVRAHNPMAMHLLQGVIVDHEGVHGSVLFYNKWAAEHLDRKPEYLGRDVRERHHRAVTNPRWNAMLQLFLDGRDEPFRCVARPYRKTTILVTVSPIRISRNWWDCRRLYCSRTKCRNSAHASTPLDANPLSARCFPTDSKVDDLFPSQQCRPAIGSDRRVSSDASRASRRFISSCLLQHRTRRRISWSLWQDT